MWKTYDFSIVMKLLKTKGNNKILKMKEIFKIWYFYHKLIVFLLDFHFLIDFNTKFSGPIIFFKRIEQPIFDKEKKIQQRNYGKSFEIDFFPFWN